MKAKVDSAGVEVKADAKAQQKNSSSNALRPLKPALQEPSRDGAVSKLPDDVRDKVEKAISEIDRMNQDRQVQFKEYEKKHLGSK